MGCEGKKRVLFVMYTPTESTAFRFFSSLLKDKYELSYLHIPDLTPAKSTFSEQHLDLSVMGDFCKGYDYVLFTVTYFHTALTFRILEHLKESVPGIVTIVGGPQVVLDPEPFIAYADYVCLFEGEEIRNLLEHLDTGAEHRSVGNFVCRPEDIPHTLDWVKNLDDLPMPDYLSGQSYTYSWSRILQTGQHPVINFETVRGCYFNCTFCSMQHLTPLKKENGIPLIRFKSMKNTLQQLEDLTATCTHIEHISFSPTDNFLFHDLDSIREFSSAYDENVGVPFDIVIDFRSADFKEKIRHLAKLRSLAEIHLGIQTGSEEFNRKVYNRVFTNEDLLDKFEFMRETLSSGVRLVLDFIYGHPEETEEDVLKTLNLMLKLKGSDICLNQYISVPDKSTPHPETERLGYAHYDGEKLRENPYCYFLLYVTRSFHRNGLSFLLPKRFTPNTLTRFLNSSVLAGFYLSAIRLSKLTGLMQWRLSHLSRTLKLRLFQEKREVS